MGKRGGGTERKINETEKKYEKPERERPKNMTSFGKNKKKKHGNKYLGQGFRDRK